MNFSIRTLMLNVTYVAIAIAAWCSDSQIFLALVTFFFVILILRSVICCLLATENRTYWIGSATMSCGILLSSPNLLIFEGIAKYEDSRRHATYSNSTFILPVLPSPSATIEPSLPPSTTWSAAPLPTYVGPSPSYYNMNGAYWGFPGGFAGVLKSFLVTAVAYLTGAIAGAICMKVSVLPSRAEPHDMATK